MSTPTPFYVQSEQIRGEPRRYWILDSRDELRRPAGSGNGLVRPIVDDWQTFDRRRAEQRCVKKNLLHAKELAESSR